MTIKSTQMKAVKLRAEGRTLTLEPVLTNKKRQKIYVAKNPRSWQTNYSVWSFQGGGWLLVSHHRTKVLAVAAAKRLNNKDVLKVLGWR